MVIRQQRAAAAARSRPRLETRRDSPAMDYHFRAFSFVDRFTSVEPDANPRKLHDSVQGIGRFTPVAGR